MGKGSGDDCRGAMSLDAAVSAVPVPRPATQEDVPRMLELKQQITRRIYGELAGEAALAEWQQRFCSPEYFQQRIGSADNEFFVVEQDGAVVAMAALKVRDGKAYMGDLYCAHDGRGYGRRLTEQRMARARALGLTAAVCDVFSTNDRALAFVRRQGYEITDGYTEQSFGVHVHRLTKTLR